jgi:hypothetical protein
MKPIILHPADEKCQPISIFWLKKISVFKDDIKATTFWL